MNYYERHLGDYARDTGHLSLLEHGVYVILLDRYYATEAPIPADQAYRIARARTDDERAAVDAVLSDFFTLSDGAWRQARVDKAIADYQEGDADREARRDNAKERQRRARERRAALFAQLRDVGEVPAWDTPTSQLERLLSRASAQPVTPPVATPVTPVTPVTRDNTATQSPIPNPHTPIKKQELRSPSGSRLPAGWALPADWRAWAKTERPDIDPDREAESFADYWHGVAGAKGRKADWQATWRNWIRNARGQGARGSPRPAQPTQSKTLTAIQTLQAMKHGNLDSPRDSGRPEQAALPVAGTLPGR